MDLLSTLKGCSDDDERLALLEKEPLVKEGFKKHPRLKQLERRLRQAAAAIFAIGQGDLVFQGLEEETHTSTRLQHLLHSLKEVDEGYRPIGGIVGYHATVLQLLSEKGCGPQPCNSRFLHPLGTEIYHENTEVKQLIRWGIEALPALCEFYPVGGAGERLNLKDEHTGEPLPVAALLFDGRTLLEGLIRDLQAKEYLYAKLSGKEVVLPIVMMTSHEKDNRTHIESICRAANWFERGKENFYFYDQPLVPVITKEGNWSLKAPLVLNLKPGGHGVLWKIAEEKGIFDRLEEKGIWKALVRQINNPVAGLDYGLLAFTGKGAKEERAFGFASCERLLNTPEGVDVVVENPLKEGFEYTLTNVEYTEFEERGIADVPSEAGGTCSAYPSNTNILFANLKAVRKALQKLPFPGMLINMKTKTPSLQKDGTIIDIEAGRLETTMQNIADALGQAFDHEADVGELMNLPTYITYNKRSKTISVAKAAYVSGKSLTGTPEGCYRDLQKEHAALLKECGYILEGEAYISYLPALGPLYSIISQKIRKGKLGRGTELRLEIAELDMENVEVEGSLQIQAAYQGKCTLKNVKIQNQGIDSSKENIYWKNQIERFETLQIVIEGDGEFIAEGVVFKGAMHIQVPAGHRVEAKQKGEGIELVIEKLERPSWCWEYQFDRENTIRVKKRKK